MEKCFNRKQMNMKSLVLALLLMGAVIGVANAASTQPPLPTSYWGNVRIAGNGSLIPNTSITVLAAGTIIASNTSNSDGSYLVIVPWDDPATTQVDGVVSGETITFTVSGKTVTSRVIDAEGTNNNLDLNVPTTTTTTSGGSSGGSSSGGGGGVIVPTATPAMSATATATPAMASATATATQAMPTGTGTPSPTATNKVPGFEFVLTIAILSAAYLFGRKSR
jgi:hypothetical protein